MIILPLLLFSPPSGPSCVWCHQHQFRPALNLLSGSRRCFSCATHRPLGFDVFSYPVILRRRQFFIVPSPVSVGRSCLQARHHGSDSSLFVRVCLCTFLFASLEQLPVFRLERCCFPAPPFRIILGIFFFQVPRTTFRSESPLFFQVFPLFRLSLESPRGIDSRIFRLGSAIDNRRTFQVDPFQP